MSATELPFYIWVATILVVSATAFWWGGPSERIGAGAFLSAWLLGLAIVALRFPGYEIALVIIDVALLGGLVALALKSSRFWPLAAAGFHLLAVMTHWARELDPTLNKWTYVTAGIIWGYLPLFALAYGTWGAWRARRQLGAAA